MANRATTDGYFQEFRVVSASSSTPINNPTILIASRLDKTTGDRIVLWKEIQKAARDADQVRNGKILVPFVMDDDTFEEVLPLRILYHPGVVLDVIVTSHEEVAIVSKHSNTLPESMANNSAQCVPNVSSSGTICPGGGADVTSAVQRTSNLCIATANAVDKSLVVQSAILDNEVRSLQQYHANVTQFTGESHQQVMEISPVDDFIIKRLKEMEVTGTQGGNDLFQVHTLHLLQQMLDRQQQTLNRQVILENRMQALMTQNYELHEYPIPRLFIVLPKPKRCRDKMTHPLSKQFRLHFLCECGDHTTGAGRGNLPNKIHLAKHEGYDLDQPNEFFQRYGSYVLTMMKFVKYGVMAAGVAVPPLAMFKVVEGIETIQKSLGMTIDKVGSLVDETIKHIQEMEKNSEVGRSATAGPMRLDDIEALEGADLRQLQLYLNEKDKGRVLGDLFRIFTPDGHVKWVCIDHYKENYRKAAIKRLKDVVKANDGGFIRVPGMVVIKLRSTTMANQFYEVMVKAHGIRTLDIILEWDVTLEDLRVFASAVTKANISRLVMDGTHFKGPMLDVFNNGRRYDPILDLMCNGRLHEMVLRDIDHFYQRIDVSSMTMATHLKSLNLFALKDVRSKWPTLSENTSKLSLYDRDCKPILMRLLKRCPSLVELEIGVTDLIEAYEDLTGVVSILPKKLTICGGGSQVDMEVSERKVQSVRAVIKSSNINPSIMPLLQKGHLTELEMAVDSEASIMPELDDVLLLNPKIRTVHLMECSLQSATVETITSAREKILLKRGSCELHQVKLKFRLALESLRISLVFLDGSDSPVVSSYYRMDRNDCHLYRDVIMLYGWSLSTLMTTEMFDDDCASVLDKVTEEKGSKIEDLTLHLAALTTDGIECMERVIDRSQELERLTLVFDNLHEERWLEKFERLIRRYGKRLTGLVLHGESPNVWIPTVMTLCPTRTDLPMLKRFRLSAYDEDSSMDERTRRVFESHQLSCDCAQWIAAMVSGSPQPRSALPSSLIQSTITPIHSAPILDPLSLVDLSKAQLQPDGWEIVIKALDLSALQHLWVSRTFTLDIFKLLVDHITLSTNQRLYIIWDIRRPEEEAETHVEKLLAKSPNITFHWSNRFFFRWY